MRGMPQPVILVASGDLRPAANQLCWPAQKAVEDAVSEQNPKARSRRQSRPSDQSRKRSWIHRQPAIRDGSISGHPMPTRPSSLWRPCGSTVIMCLAGLSDAQRSDSHGRELERSMARAGWHAQPERLADQSRREVQHALERRLSGSVSSSMVCALARRKLAAPSMTAMFTRSAISKLPKRRAGNRSRTGAAASIKDKAIMGVFDEGCMGMYNAIIPDELLHPTGVFKERLSQSMLYAAMQACIGGGSASVRDWLRRQGMRFITGTDPEKELTEAQILDQCRMYIAAVATRRRIWVRHHRHSVSARA